MTSQLPGVNRAGKKSPELGPSPCSLLLKACCRLRPSFILIIQLELDVHGDGQYSLKILAGKKHALFSRFVGLRRTLRTKSSFGTNEHAVLKCYRGPFFFGIGYYYELMPAKNCPSNALFLGPFSLPAKTKAGLKIPDRAQANSRQSTPGTTVATRESEYDARVDGQLYHATSAFF
jgi:hypothetical protein